MGYIKHDLVIVVVFDGDDVKRLNGFLDEVEGAAPVLDDGHDEMEIIRTRFHHFPPGTNGYHTYVMAPDGSKEGWDTSNLADEWRAKFIAVAKQCRFASVTHIDRFGGDDNEPRFVESAQIVNYPPGGFKF